MDLPQKHYDLVTFCKEAKNLLGIDQATFVRFMLTGIRSGHQAVVDPISHNVEEGDDLRVLRDYDSLLIMHSDILVQDGDLTLYPVSKHEDALTKDIHVKYEFVNSGVIVCFLLLLRG